MEHGDASEGRIRIHMSSKNEMVDVCVCMCLVAFILFFFLLQSQICSTLFDTYRPNNVLGGTFTGSIVLWDTRAKTRPVQRTPLSPKSHNHPVSC